ncbi:tripartite tricarboxylate transporter permease [Pararhizobium sp. IMCC21322]|uniref:tripartite tricarboxylate transporter permease n=1 Tax=Pararhizobium sp. IMCC21322 TaxID=3067903 RepID=UPI00274288DD|nr:tripartite tricarboxylate transporter permease [Pararhizobium sp. IMCC21322]
MQNLLESLSLIFTFQGILALIIGVVIGTFVGAMPGLGTVVALAMMLPLTFAIDSGPAIILLLSVYVSSVYGGSVSAILINVPGTPQSAATVLDGYPMTKAGRADEALGWATGASVFGGIFSVLILVTAAPTLSKVAINFGSIEILALIIFSMTTIAWVSHGNTIKGLLAALLGLFLSTVGQDNFTGLSRFDYGNFSLSAGFHVIPILVGIFALSEVFHQAFAGPGAQGKVEGRVGFKVAGLRAWMSRSKQLLRASAIGSFIGVLPGVGAVTAAFVSYADGKQSSPNSEKFGTGEPDGIIASEASNNAVTGGALVPTLALGIPGDGGTAVLIGALIIHGVTPGVRLYVDEPVLVNMMFLALFFANILLFFVGAFSAGIFTRLLKLPASVLMPIVMMLSLIGAYTVRSSMLDVYVAIIAGFFGLFLRYGGFQLAPIVIGYVLGQPFEEGLRRGLLLTGDQPLRFFESPIFCLFIGLTVLVLTSPLWMKLLRRNAKA